MATPNQLDALERILKTHRAPGDDLKRCLGRPLESLTDEEASKTIHGLADGEFGGISTGGDGAKLTGGQHRAIAALAVRLWDAPFPDELRAYIRQFYPRIASVREMNKRQACRVIVELDRLCEASEFAVLPVVTEV